MGPRQEILPQSSQRTHLNMNGEKDRTQGKDADNDQRHVRSRPASSGPWPRYRQDSTCAGHNCSGNKDDQGEHGTLPTGKRRLCRIVFAFLVHPCGRAPRPGCPWDEGSGAGVVSGSKPRLDYIANCQQFTILKWLFGDLGLPDGFKPVRRGLTCKDN
jgi:hypothetical protein